MDIHHRVMRLVCRAAQRIGDKNDAEAQSMAPSMVASTQQTTGGRRMPTKSFAAEAKSRKPGCRSCLAVVRWHGVAGARSEPARDPKQSWTSGFAALGTIARHRPSATARLPTLHQMVPRAV